MIVIAVDCVSFDADASRGDSGRPAIRAATVSGRLGRSVGLPERARAQSDHRSRRRPSSARHRRRPARSRRNDPVPGQAIEIVDITRELTRGGGPTVDAVLARECSSDPTLQPAVDHDVTNTALFYEARRPRASGMLRPLIEEMRSLLGRKTLVLISGGMIASDTPGGRPDLSDLGIRVGKEAALANTAIYTLYLDSSVLRTVSAQTRAADKSMVNWGRDSALLGRWLKQFSGAAGGALFTVAVGNAESALARITTELDVLLPARRRAGGRRPRRPDARNLREDQPAERHDPRPAMGDGPERRGGPAPATASAPASNRQSRPGDLPPATPAPPPPPARRVVPPTCRRLPTPTIAAPTTRCRRRSRNRPASRTRSAGSGCPTARGRTIRGARPSSRWSWRSPVCAARTATHATRAGACSPSTTRVGSRRAPTRSSARGSSPSRQRSRDSSCRRARLLFIPRAAALPHEPRLHLARVRLEQQWLRGGLTPAQELEVVQRYEEAMKFPETELEARVRAARFLYGSAVRSRAAVLDGGNATPLADKEVQLLPLVRGTDPARARSFRRRGRGLSRRAHDLAGRAVGAGRADDAARQSAASARKPATLAEAAQTAPEDQYDPWWTYWLGDFRAYPAMLDKLRELGR